MQMKNLIAALLPFCVSCVMQAASLPNIPADGPEATAAITGAEFCFAHERKLDVDRTPPSYLVLNLKIRVSYRNAGPRALIVPLGREKTVYTALRPGIMKISPQPQNFPDDETFTLMKNLPADVSRDNPVRPANDVFTVIPAGGAMTPAFDEEVILPVNRKNLFKREPDLRGRRLYVRLQFDHQDLAPALEADLSDRWAKFGAPWTGMTRTNTVSFDVPKAPPASRVCVDSRVPEKFDGHLQTNNNK